MTRDLPTRLLSRRLGSGIATFVIAVALPLVAVPLVPSGTAAAAPSPAVVQSRAVSSGRGASVVRAALAQVGKSYRRNGLGPSSFDCSGLVAYAYARVGKAIPHSSRSLARLPRVSLSNLQPGDVVGRAGHVGIYIGGGRMVHAAAPGKGVRVDPVGHMRWAVRP